VIYIFYPDHLMLYRTEPLLIQPLLRERTSILRLQTLWITPLTPKHVFPSHVQRAVDLALHISGKPPRPVALHWLPSQVSPSTQNHEDYLDNDDNADEWEDIPCLDPSQAMLADVITDDSPVELTIDSVWIPSVCYFKKYLKIRLTSYGI
jgi:hypothetical protein